MKRDTVESLLRECSAEMGMTTDEVISQVLISANGKIDYRKVLNEQGQMKWLQDALNGAIRRNTFVPSRSPVPLNFFSGDW